MTEQEARKKIDECEKRIVSSYNKLCSDVRCTGKKATEIGSGKATNRLAFLLISVLGLILCCTSSVFWGIVLVIAGIWITYTTYTTADEDHKKVDRLRQQLNGTLDANSEGTLLDKIRY